MAFIQVPKGLPGIIGPMTAYPETSKLLNGLAQTLLVQDSPTFSKAERETVANYVSYLNDCQFSQSLTQRQRTFIGTNRVLAKKFGENPESAPISERLKVQLKLAAKVQKAAKTVTQEDVDAVKKLGATEKDIHDTVLIAAAFCMFNRYVDGLGTLAPPRGDQAYLDIGKRLGSVGYKI